MSLFDSASLVVTPSGYKEAKLYSIKPTDGSGDLVVTRATTATRVNSDGLIEQVPYNFVQYSNTFNNGVWVTGGYGNLPTLTANSIQNPVNGLTDAWLASFSASGTQGRLLQLFSGLSVGVPCTYSMYVKAGTKTSVTIYSDTASVGYNAVYNLSNGTITSVSGVTATITEVSNGWYFLTLTNDILPTGLGQYGIVSATGQDGTLYIYGAQLVSGTSAKEYFPTTDRLNVPRLDYTNSSCPSILVEPQRTNLALRSEEFDNVSWVKVNTTITANAIISPDGTINADLCNYTAGSGSYINGGAIFAGNSDVVISVFVKANTISIFRIRESFYTGVSCVFDLSAQTAGTNGKIENYGNGWYRCSFKYNLSLGQTNINFIFDSNTATGSLYLWGAQAEVGSYPTSYIPTVASSVTRNADVISKTGISSLIGQTEGTLFWDINVDIVSGTDSENIINIDNGFFGTTLYLIKTSVGTLGGELYNGGVVQFSSTTSITQKGRYKCALAYKTNDFALYINGVQIAIDSSGTVGAMSRIQLGQGVLGASVGNTNAAVLWKTRLSNETLAQLTTI